MADEIDNSACRLKRAALKVRTSSKLSFGSRKLDFLDTEIFNLSSSFFL